MQIKLLLSGMAFLLLTGSVQAYVPNMGGSGGGDACAKPKFSHFTPDPKTAVKAKSEFSFVASANTHPNTIKVNVKGIPVAVTTSTKSENAFKVTGILPDAFKNTFVRVSISGESSGQCKGTDGWLIKVTD